MNPGRRKVQVLGVESERLIAAGKAPHHLAGGVEHFQRNNPAGRRPQVVINHGAVWRILGLLLIEWHRCAFERGRTNAVRRLRPEKVRLSARHVVAQLAQRRHVIQYPERSPMSGDHEVIIVDHQVTHGTVGQVQLQGLPLVTIVKRNKDAGFRARIEQALSHRVLTHGVDEAPFRNALDDFRPRLAAVARALDMRLEVFQAMPVDGRVDGVSIVARGLDDSYL